MAGLVSDPLLWKLNYDRVWGASSTTDLQSDASASGSGIQSASATSAPDDNSMEDNSEGLGEEAEERGKEIGEGMRGGPLAGDDVSNPTSSPDVDRESDSEDEGGTTKNEDVEVDVEVVRMTERKSEANKKAKTTAAVAKKPERDWREEYRARLEYEHRGWKAKNILRLSKKVTNVETHHNATFITSLAVNRPPILEPAKMTKVKASCFVLVVDRMTSSLHRKDDYLAIAPNWELDNGIVRVIEMKSYKKKKTVILRPHAIASPLLARFSSAHGDGRMAIAPQQEPGVVEVWDWANDRTLHQFPVSSHATAMDFCYNDIILGDASGPVAIYDVRRQASAPTSVLSGHTDKVTCMQRRDEMLATGSGDGTVRVWDLRQRSAPMFQLEGHSISFVSSLQFDSQKLIFSAVHSPPNHYFWQNARDRNPFRHQMLHVWNARTFEFWNSLDFSKECAEATSPMSFDFEGNFLVVGVPRQVVMLNFYNNAHCIEP
jgi:WD40 repeat protein